MNTLETIEAFRRGALDIDCRSIALKQRGEGRVRYRGPGYIRQDPEGNLAFKVYVNKTTANASEWLRAWSSRAPGKLYIEDMLYDFVAIAQDGTTWKANRILPAPHWNMSTRSVIVVGSLRSMTAILPWPQERHHLRLHFFEEYRLPLHLSSRVEDRGIESHVVDRAQFSASGTNFEVQTRDGWGDTVVEARSERRFPNMFHLRVQEALQFITGKSAFYRARLQSINRQLALELASPTRRSSRTQFDPPISPASIEWRQYTWKLFESYLTYTVRTTNGTHWNSIAYHLYNACEATGASVDAWALGLSVAVEALVPKSTKENRTRRKELRQLSRLQEQMLQWLSTQRQFAPYHERVKKLLESMPNPRPQNTLHELADAGYVNKTYIKDWAYLRNRHAHPKIRDLRKADPIENQELLDRIHRVEVLLRQLAFCVIGYQGPYTDYGVHGFPPKQYPLGAPPTP